MTRLMETIRNAALDASLIIALAGCAVAATVLLWIVGEEQREKPWKLP